ncbi:hypothetical protein NQZ68_022072 [Dissostichus eleginoides]|nr:hypothetical protein NQZ68_022072 [Dissostichus eleginoides]
MHVCHSQYVMQHQVAPPPHATSTITTTTSSLPPVYLEIRCFGLDGGKSLTELRHKYVNKLSFTDDQVP